MNTTKFTLTPYLFLYPKKKQTFRSPHVGGANAENHIGNPPVNLQAEHGFLTYEHIMRKPVFALCEQQRCRSACASGVANPEDRFSRDEAHIYCNVPKFMDRQVWANSADPDQQSDQGTPIAIPTQYCMVRDRAKFIGGMGPVQKATGRTYFLLL